MKHYLQILSFVFILFAGGNAPIFSNEVPSPQQVEWMGKEYKAVSSLRHRLKELIERQKFEEVLQEGNDAYSSFQNLEQWFQNLEDQKGNKDLDDFMKALQEFEKHMESVLGQQQEFAEQYPGTLMPQSPTEQIPLSQAMEAIKQLVQQGKIQEARELLNQLFAAFDAQQQQMQQGISQLNDSKYRETQQQLSRLNQQLSEALKSEKQVRQMLSKNKGQGKMPEQTAEDAQALQNQITQMLEGMKDMLENMVHSPLVEMDGLKKGMGQAQTSSQRTEEQIQMGNQPQASQGAMLTQTLLQRMQNQVGKAQQQIQQLTRPMGQRGRNQRGFNSEKGVRPPKFEYEFQVDPAFRQSIQRFNQQEHQTLTPEQQQYLQDVIK